MRLVRRLALIAPVAALLAPALAPPGAGAVGETCTTAVGGGPVVDRPAATAFDGPLATSCAAAVLIVNPNPVAPEVFATLDGSQSVGGDAPDQIATYEWDFGDGATDVTTVPTSSATHAYVRGRYTARLTIVTAANSPLDTASVDVTAGTPPVAALSGPSGRLRPGVAYGFDASGSSAPDAGGSVVRYDWSWGDGTTTADGGPTPQHTFASDGASTQVTVTVYDDLGLADTATVPVSVANVLPLVQLIATPATVQVGQQLTLDAGGTSDPDGAIVEYRWDLDANGSFETSTGTTATATAGGYPNPGIVTLRVKAIDDSGGSSVKGVPVTVARPATSGGSGSGSGSGSESGSGSGAGGSGSGAGGGARDPFAVGLGGAAIQRLKAALRRGIGLQAVANRAATGTLTVSVTARDAKRLRLAGRKGGRPVAIGTLRLALRAGRTAKPAIKLSKRAAGALRRAQPRMLRVTIRGALVAGGDSAAVVRVVLLRS